MSYRFMRILVFFDLPVATSENRRNYRKFRQNLIKRGFYMLQESVYTRMLITANMAESVMAQIEECKPPKGVVSALTVTEKQFSKMLFLVGEDTSDVISTTKNLVIL